MSCFCRYVKIVKEEGLEISQPALDPNSTEIHHRITIRARNKKFHRWWLIFRDYSYHMQFIHHCLSCLQWFFSLVQKSLWAPGKHKVFRCKWRATMHRVTLPFFESGRAVCSFWSFMCWHAYSILLLWMIETWIQLV